jgi:uncharacterized protein
MEILPTLLLLALSGMVQGITGFGFGIAAMSLLPHLTDLQTASAVVAVTTLLVIFTTLHSTGLNWKDFRTYRAFLIGSLVGTPIGVYCLILVDQKLLLVLLGCMMVAFSANELIIKRYKAVPVPHQLGFPLGCFSGALAGAFNMGGPPAVAYVYSKTECVNTAIASLQIIFFVNSVGRLAFMGGTGLITRDVLMVSLLALLPIAAAVWGGRKLAGKVPDTLIRKGVFVWLGIAGIGFVVF